MTGANRILIGLGWSGIALYAIYRTTRGQDAAVVRREGLLADAVELDPRIAVEIVFLGVATLYAFAIPLFGGIDALDAVFLVGFYVAYVVVIFRGEAGEEVALGVPGVLHRWSPPRRALAVLASSPTRGWSSCCRSKEVLAATCRGCGARMFEVEAPRST